MTRLFQITEDDLSELEHIMPTLCGDMMPLFTDKAVAPRLRTQLRRVQTILSDVRWGYGPPSDVGCIELGDPPPTDYQAS